MDENDPDTLQLCDELDMEWVSRWRTEVAKKKTIAQDLTFIGVLNEKETANQEMGQKSSV